MLLNKWSPDPGRCRKDRVSNSTSGEKCLKCGYCLDDPSGDRCPRCGYCLDPELSRTLPSGDPGCRSIVSGVPYLLAGCFGLLLVAAPFLYMGSSGEVGGGGLFFGIIRHPYFLLSLFGIPAGVLIEVGVLLRLRPARLRGRWPQSATAAKWLARLVIIIGIIPSVLIAQSLLASRGLVRFGLLLMSLLLGLILVVIGARGKRVRSVSYCRKCDCNLTGLTSERCPECGTPVTPRTVVYGGAHRQNWRMVALGAAMPFLVLMSNTALFAL